MSEILDFKKKKIAKVDSLGEVEPGEEQQTDMLVKLQSLLEDLKERTKSYGEKLAAIGDENDSLTGENQKLRNHLAVAVKALEYCAQEETLLHSPQGVAKAALAEINADKRV